MKDDPIVEEVRRHRQAYAREFNFDAKAILADLNARAGRHRARMVSYPPRPVETRRPA